MKIEPKLSRSDLSRLERAQLSGGVLDYRRYAVNLTIGKEDLWLDASELAMIEQGELTRGEVVAYPFGHKLSFPAVYQIFQAAFSINVLGSEPAVVLSKIGDRVPGALNHKRSILVEKLISMKWDRAQGRRGPPRPFKISEIESQLEDPLRFFFPFVSEGLTVVLAAAWQWEELLVASPMIA